MDENFMTQYGDRLMAGGFPFLPIMPGEKFPGRFMRGEWMAYRGWTKHASRATTVHELTIWKQWPNAGIGIPCGLVVGVDIDISDDIILSEQLQALAFAVLGATPAIRIGRHPKRMLVYRTATPFKGIKAHPLEVLCQGQQFVAYAIHPGTGQSYEWPVQSLADLTLATLPAITEVQAHDFIEQALAMLPEGLRPTRLDPAQPGMPEQTETCAPLQSIRDLVGTPEAIQDALRHIVNADLPYDDWVRVGMAIKGALGEAGAGLFADWSASSVKNVPAATERAWASFHPTVIGAGTIYHLAQKHGWRPDVAITLNPANKHPGPHPAEELLRKAQQVPEQAPKPVPILPGDAEFDPCDVEGVLKELLEFMLATATQPQPVLSVGNALCALGALMGHRFRSETNLRTNLYIVGIAESGSGKNHSREVINQVFHDAGLFGFLGGNRIASGSGLLAAMHRHPPILFQQDEFGMFLQAAADRKRSPRYLTEILDLMTEIHSAAGTVFLGPEYGGIKDAKDRKDIVQPCLCVYGTTTPMLFWSALKSANVADGSLARFVILRTMDDYPERNRINISRDTPTSLIMSLKTLSESGGKGRVKGRGNLEGTTNNGTTALHPSVVPMLPEAAILFDALSETITAQLRRSRGSLYSPILARVWEHAAKVAMIRAVAANPSAPVIRRQDAQWAIALVRYSVNSMIQDVEHHVADNLIEQNHKRVLEIIRAAGRNGVTKTDLGNKSRFLTRRERNEILAELEEEEIVRSGQVLSGGPKPITVYTLTNQMSRR
ncbi:MAG: PriCT-2 domain-containing protein [Magnetococcales bacterium]|nr:PriCT-2 domain-containing protein [Magnetococcales bacterium]